VKLGRPAATPALVGLLQDRDRGVRATAMERLSEWYDPPALAEFAKLLTDDDPDVRRRAAILLAEHVGGQQELRAAVASATTAGEAHNVPKSDMKAISEATDALVAGPAPASQQALDGYYKSTDKGIRYAAVGGVATVARRTKAEANREWALTILDGVLDEPAPDPDPESNARLEWQQFQQTAAVAVAQARVPGILEAAVLDSSVGRNVLHESVKALGLLGTDTSVDKLIPLCERGGEDGRAAADAIGKIGRRLSEESEGRAPEAMQAAQTLIDLAKAERDPELRAELGLAVAMIGEAAVTPSIESLNAAQDDEERAFLAAIIGKLGNVAVDPYLLRARNSVRDAQTAELLGQRDWLTVALYTTGDKMARDFCEALPDEEDPPQEEIEAAAAQLEALNDAM
jgi:HEAT repeat protein